MMEKSEAKDTPDYDIPSSSTNTSVSTQCKACKKDFTVSTIFKHVSHKESCKAIYSNDEIEAFKSWKKQRDEEGRNRKYDAAKRRERYLNDQKRKLASCNLSDDEDHPVSDIVSSQCLGCKINFRRATILKHVSHSPSCRSFYSKDDISELYSWTKQRNDQNRSKKRKYDPEARRARHLLERKRKNSQKIEPNIEKPLSSTTPVTISTRCKRCKVLFNHSSILKHISHSKLCKAAYSNEEMREFDVWKNERRSKKHYEKVGKFKEKLSDRFSLKGQSFLQVYNKAFDVACDNFLNNLKAEAITFLHRTEYFKEVYDQTLDSIFHLRVWMTYFEDDNFSLNCDETTWKTKYLNSCPNVPEVCPYLNSNSPCQYHCSESLLVELIEKSMDLAFEKNLEKNISKIAKALAEKTYKNPCYSEYFECQIHGKFKNLIYKKAFASFYHDAIFISIYDAAYDKYDTPKEPCSNVFEKKVIEEVLETSLENVVKTMSSFIYEEMKTKFSIKQIHYDAWRSWLDREKQNFGNVLHLSNTL